VALDPKTGAVLALVTSPTYDPNDIASHDIEAAGKAYDRLAADPQHPLSNRAAREIYPPGSTFKLVTAAAALADGKTPDSLVDSPDRLKLPGTRIYLPNSTNCGGTKITITQALRVSCNTAFANLGLELGDDKLREQAQAFGFDRRHLADLMDPFIVSSVRSADLTPLETNQPQQLSTAMTPENAKELQQMMLTVVNQGTGHNAQIPGVEVGGKTGTAQSDPKRKPFAWFTSFAPVDDPKVAVAVIVEDANIPRNDIAGGRIAAPIAKAVMEAAL